MKTVQILGPGCRRCEELLENARVAIEAMDGDFEVKKITGLKEITDFGVMMTPALAVDGKVLSFGEVLSSERVRELLEGAV